MDKAEYEFNLEKRVELPSERSVLDSRSDESFWRKIILMG